MNLIHQPAVHSILQSSIRASIDVWIQDIHMGFFNFALEGNYPGTIVNGQRALSCCKAVPHGIMIIGKAFMVGIRTWISVPHSYMILVLLKMIIHLFSPRSYL